MDLYGIYGSHTAEACPLFHDGNRKLLLHAAENLESAARELGMQVVGAYHSGLEHTFLWIIQADSAHALEKLMVDAGPARFNTLRIVPLSTLESVVQKCQRMSERG